MLRARLRGAALRRPDLSGDQSSVRHVGLRRVALPVGDTANAMRRYIGQTIDGFVVVEGKYAQLSFWEHSFTVPLDDQSRRGPEALHVVGVEHDGKTDARHMWIW